MNQHITTHTEQIKQKMNDKMKRKNIVRFFLSEKGKKRIIVISYRVFFFYQKIHSHRCRGFHSYFEFVLNRMELNLYFEMKNRETKEKKVGTQRKTDSNNTKNTTKTR